MRFYLAVILAISFLENFKVHIVRGTLGTQAMAHNSCVSLRTEKISIRRIANYEIQNHPQKVVILITRNGIKICVPHNLPWVNQTINTLDKRKNKRKTEKS
ncbi:lymphotactin [Python bivittatus]|uniref:Lymphotactin n=1 Tax=Python bivittatus TaxID=176946 RepID=A0A9F2PN90_PYTBI|nr:lymphotactin [Python bivittatus]